MTHPFIRGDFSIANADDSMGIFGNVALVRYENNGVPFRMKPIEELHDFHAELGTGRSSRGAAAIQA